MQIDARVCAAIAVVMTTKTRIILLNYCIFYDYLFRGNEQRSFIRGMHYSKSYLKKFLKGLFTIV